MQHHVSRFIVHTAGTAVLLAAAGVGHAQPQKLRPGLWEHTVSMKSQSGQMEAAMAQMQKSLASMTPEQRKQMEQMMAQQGVSMGPKGNSVKMCITAEQAELDNIPQQEGCTQTVKRTGPNTVALTFNCKGGDGQPPTSGEGSMTFAGPTAYTGNFKVKTMSAGKPEQIDMAQAGKWLSADCGAIKPVR
ncbi:MAG: DUF3617 domain-containing protein [Gammaproteobacteria bacterium]|jgi:hypothetical protein|nr:DUF3617 domain-containing protein [Gammaproteobacteria bacterium]MBU0828892.1 DUF3617 domain-containing protein [Gammaproteobacteria bacterium]MBU0891733.1 DUF3617 domain-containing protein [Gammaproteobacteria bacterium]MBU1351734.1 DUF3617 domain-containing protein [Gammaproteobacteria bacterium]MBU1507352.1 DUF3617 domain-containing protein [Gammaproteobacteria bacterium]